MAGVNTRNIDRDSLFLMADLTLAGQTEATRVKVRNLSAGGLMSEADVPVERGMRVVVELRNIGKVDGTVAWVQGRRFGVAFEKEIDPKLARSQVSTGGESNVPRYARSTVDYSSQAEWRKNIRPI